MKDDDLNDTQQTNVGRQLNYWIREKEPSVYEREIWNAAIEAAAKVIDDCNHEGPYNAIGGARRIRKLKK